MSRNFGTSTKWGQLKNDLTYYTAPSCKLSLIQEYVEAYLMHIQPWDELLR